MECFPAALLSQSKRCVIKELPSPFEVRAGGWTQPTFDAQHFYLLIFEFCNFFNTYSGMPKPSRTDFFCELSFILMSYCL